MTGQTASRAESIGTLEFNRRMIGFQPFAFGVHTLLTILVFSSQILPGLIVKTIFDHLSGQGLDPSASNLWPTIPMTGPSMLGWLVGLYVVVEVVRIGLSFGAEWFGWTFRLAVGNLLRRNLFASILRRPGDQPLPVSPGEAVHRFYSDVGEVADFPTWLPDQLGKWIAAGVAIAIMASIHLTITLIIFLPLVFTILLTRLAWGKILHYNAVAAREADRVAGFLSEAFGAVQAVKVANAEENVTAEFQRLAEERARAAIRLQLFWGLLNSLNGGVVSFGIGVVLLLAGTAISSGTFTVGDFALFVSYLWFTTQVPSELGTFFGDYKTQEVSINRMLEMVRPDRVYRLVERHPVSPRKLSPEPPVPIKTSADRLDRLEVRGLTFRFPGNHGESERSGIESIDLAIFRGEFVVVTGMVGSGKSTLLRVLLGLLPRQAGEICWNGQIVEDPAVFFRPPRCAYTPQAARLFSDSLRENLLLGLPEDQVDLPGAIFQSVLEEDVASLESGLDTLVGPRGIRLSGGQVQRAAAARMFVRTPDLLVFDDLSSALDVRTEQALWERLDAARVVRGGAATGGMTCVAVSHRQAALQRADRILVLKSGRLIAEGTLPQLLGSCEEMQRLWTGEDGN
jgi:ATP-binding cassette subfamily B protein